MAATIDRLILEWWDATEALTTLVPTARVSAEAMLGDEDLPEDEDGDLLQDDFVVYDAATEVLWRTNSGAGYRSEVVFTASSAEYSAAKTITQQIRAAWERQTFEIDGGKITTSLVGDETTEQDDDGMWTSTVSLTLNHNTA